MSEPMSLSIVPLIRYWTAAVNNIHNFCKLGLFFTFVSYKMRQVDYCTHVPSLFTHSCTHRPPDAIAALADDCFEHDCVVKETLQIHFPKTINVFGFFSWHNHSIQERLLLGSKQAKLGNVLFQKSMFRGNHILIWSGRGYHNSVAQELKGLISNLFILSRTVRHWQQVTQLCPATAVWVLHN